MDFFELLSRWVHVGTAIVLLGGSVYTRFVLLPAARQLPDEAHQKLRELTVARWKKFVHGGILLLLLTGFYNYLAVAKPEAAFKKQYHMLMGIKILIALLLFVVASAMVGRSKAFDRMRQNPKRALGLIVLLGAVIVCISGYLRVQGTKAIRQASEAVVAPAE
ncbi:DUF2269 family protein [bacterium]|nr:DUF2269 family protein [bacterium]